jgi:hypothetical protein
VTFVLRVGLRAERFVAGFTAADLGADFAALGFVVVDMMGTSTTERIDARGAVSSAKRGERR